MARSRTEAEIAARTRQASLKLLYAQYRHNSTRSRIFFGLTMAQLESITSQPCTYCKAEPTARKGYYSRGKPQHPEHWYAYNGIDRKCNSLGYIIENCVPCCRVCNSVKGEHLTFDEMLAAMKAILGFRQNA